MLRPDDFFDLSKFQYKELFKGIEFVWDVLKKRKNFIKKTINPNVARIRKKGSVIEKTCILYKDELITNGFELEAGNATKGTFIVYKNGEKLKGAIVFFASSALLSDDIFIGKGTVIEPGALIMGPTIIGENTEIRHCSYIRGDVIVGDRCIVGNTSELKGSIMLNGAKAGHFAYMGDSIIGNQVNLGAGTKLANLKITDSYINLMVKNKKYETGLKKFGSIIGDHTEIGCNTVVNPGVLLGKNVLVYPNTSVKKGLYSLNSIIKLKQNIEIQKREQI